VELVALADRASGLAPSGSSTASRSRSSAPSGARLTEKDALGISDSQLGLAGTIYVVGAASGALFWGYLTDRFGARSSSDHTRASTSPRHRRHGRSQELRRFALCRFFTGFGIGGEYAAINSAIDELIPARVRGWVDLAINGSYWLGAAFGAASPASC
jgi:MFS family permease